jgi:outer membrane lipopolysaccharide assembly protein LptE/RlpB
MRNTRKRAVRALLLFAVLCPCGFLKAEQTYTLSPKLQELAIKNKVNEKLGSSTDSTLYNNTLTAIDLIAKMRAEVQHREKNILDEDYQAAGWILCVMPWTPPKLPADVDTMKKLRPLLVDGVFISELRRKKLIERLNRNLLALSADQIKQQHIKPLDFFNTEGLKDVPRPPD